MDEISYRSLSDFSHEESIQLLLHIGCKAIPDDSEFVQCRMNGSDLNDVQDISDLLANGVKIPPIRVKRVLRDLLGFQSKGVPSGSVSTQRTPEVVVDAAPIAPLTLSVPISPQPITTPTASHPIVSPIPPPEVLISPSAQPTGAYDQTYKQGISDTIERFVRNMGSSLAAGLLECAYTSFFSSRPKSDKAVELWIRAYKEREKCAGSNDDKKHAAVNALVIQALVYEFWLPFRHACMLLYKGNMKGCIFWMEYDALREIFKSMDEDGISLSPDRKTIRGHIDDIFDRISWNGNDNSFRVALYSNNSAKNSNDANSSDSASSSGNDAHIDLLNSYSPFRTNSSYSDVKSPSLLVDKWDPSVTFVVLRNWPAPNNRVDIWSLWMSSNSWNFYQKYFQSDRICCEFPMFPKHILERNKKLFGESEGSIPRKLFLSQTFHELLKFRNDRLCHSRIEYNAEDLWWVFTSVLASANIASQQTSLWLNPPSWWSTPQNKPPRSSPATKTCQKLLKVSEDMLDELSRWINSQENVSFNRIELEASDSYESFIKSVNHFRRNESFLILILPPLSAEHIPSTLAAAPWNLVVDFSDVGLNTDAYLSPAWRVFQDACSSNAVVKDTRNISYKKICRSSCDVCELLKEEYPMYIPWWQPTPPAKPSTTTANPTTCERLSEIFDNVGLLVNSGIGVESDVRKDIVKVMNSICSQQVLRNRSVQVVVPLYDVFESPITNDNSGRWYFMKSRVDILGMNNRNFATAHFMRIMLRSLSELTNFNCTVLYSLCSDMLAPRADKKLEFLTSGENGLKPSDCDLKLLYLPKDVMMMRYRLSMIDLDEVGSYGDAVCIYQNRVLSPLVNLNAAQSMDIKFESIRNLSELNKCGIDLLHTQSPRFSLQALESETFFSKILNNPKYSRSNTFSKQVTPQASALLKFYFSYPPAWALFCDETMKQDEDLVPVISKDQALVAPREAWMSSLVERAEIVKGSRSPNGTLIVKHQSRTGGTTLVRKFAWSVAFNKWRSVVMVLDERFNAIGPSSLSEIHKLLRTCIHEGSYVVIIADRNILSEPLHRFCEVIRECKFRFLLIRLQRCDESSDSTSQQVFFQYGVSETVLFNKMLSKDMKDVASRMFYLMKYFDASVDIKAAVAQFDKVVMDARFKKVMFLGLLRFVHVDTQQDDKSIYRSVLAEWMTNVVRQLYEKIHNDDRVGSARNSYTTSSAVRALMYLAMIQLCSSPSASTRLDINDLYIVFNDPHSSMPLFQAWNSGNIEVQVLEKAFSNSQTRLRDMAYSTFPPVYGSILPLLSTFGRGFEASKEEEEAYSSQSESLFPFFQLFMNVKSKLSSSVYTILDPNWRMPFVPNLDQYSANYKISDMNGLLTELLKVPNPVMEGGSEGHDISDMMWTEFIEHSNGSVSFILDEAADIFLQETLKQECMRYQADSIKMQDTSSQYYVLAMSLMYTICRDDNAVNLLKCLTSVDIYHETNKDKSLAWCAQHLFIARLGDTSNRKKSEDLNEAASRSSQQLNYLPKYQKRSWLMKKIHSETNAIPDINTANACAFQSLEMKLFIASQAIYSGYWRVSSAIARFFQYQLLRLTDEVVQMSLLMQSHDETVINADASTWNKWIRSTYSKGVQLFLASSGRLILAVDECSKSSKLSEGDRKKLAGTMDQLGNCIKAFICLNREMLHLMYTRLKTHETDLTLFQNDAVSLLMALGNTARYFYGLSVRTLSQPLGFGDEVDSWLHVLEAMQLLDRKDSSIGHSRIHEIMQVYCGDRNNQWIKGAGPIVYDNHAISVGKLLGDKYEDKSYFSIHLYSVDDVLDQIHSKLVDFNDANIRTLEDKNTDLWSEDYNREDFFMERLVKLAKDSDDKGWKQLLDENITALGDMEETDPLYPFKEKSIARFAQCMWQHRQHTATEQDKVGDHKDPNRREILNSKVFHGVMVNVVESEQAYVRQVIRCIVHCMDKFTIQYPHRLMTQLFELLSFVTPRLVLDISQEDNLDFFPYTVDALLPIVEKWVISAKSNLSKKRDDEAALACALRFQTMVTFLLLWNNINRRNLEYTQVSHLQFVLHEINGHFNGVKWENGSLSTQYKEHVHFMARYLFVQPIDVSIDDITSTRLPLCIRKQFSKLDECKQEMQSIDRYCAKLLYGVVVALSINDRVEGVVCVKDSNIHLPFRYKKEEYEILKENMYELECGHPCSFYITFLPWRIEAQAVQPVQGDQSRLAMYMFAGEEKLKSIGIEYTRSKKLLVPPPSVVHTQMPSHAAVNNIREIHENRKTPTVPTISTETKRWGHNKSSSLTMQTAEAAQMEELVRSHKLAETPEGVSLATFMKLVSGYYQFDDQRFDSLSSILYPAILRDFYESGIGFNESGNALPPNDFRKQIYGYLTLDSKLFSPYLKIGPIPDDCAILAIPNFVSDAAIGEHRYCLPCCDSSIAGPTLRFLVEDAVSMLFETKNAVSFRSATSSDFISKISETETWDETIPTGNCHYRMFFLWHVTSKTLLSIREGPLVLVAEKEADGRRHMRLAVLCYRTGLDPSAIRHELEETWRRCLDRINLCPPFANQPQVRPRRVKYTSFDRVISPPSSTANSAVLDSARISPSLGVAFAADPSLSPLSVDIAVSSPTTAASSTFASIDLSVAGSSSKHAVNVKSNVASIGLSVAGGSSKPAAKSNVASIGLSVAGGASRPAVNVKSNVASIGLSVAGGASKPAAISNSAPTGLSVAVGASRPSAIAKIPETAVVRRKLCPDGLLCRNGDASGCEKGRHEGSAYRLFKYFQIHGMNREDYKFSKCTMKGRHDTTTCPMYHPGDKKICVHCMKDDHLESECEYADCPFTLNCKFQTSFFCEKGCHVGDSFRVFDYCEDHELDRWDYKFSWCTSAKAHNTRDCLYYHIGDSEAKFCAKCLKEGHFSSDCEKVCPNGVNCKHGDSVGCSQGSHAEFAKIFQNIADRGLTRRQCKFSACTKMAAHDASTCFYHHKGEKDIVMYCTKCLDVKHLAAKCPK